MSLLTQVNRKVDLSKELIPEIVSRLTKPVHFKQRKKSEGDVGTSRVKRPREDGTSWDEFQKKASIN